MPDFRKPSLVYIVGMGHSGSTLLELLLNRFKQVAAMGEISLFPLQLYRGENTRWVGRCSCGERPDLCPVWGKVIKAVNESHGVGLMKSPFSWPVSDVGLEEEYGWKAPLSMVRYHFGRFIRTFGYFKWPFLLQFFNKRIKTRIENRDELVTRYAEVTGNYALIDASKDPVEMRDITAFSQLPVKILFLTRDVNGLAWSSLRSKKQAVAQTAKIWARLNKKILQLLSSIPRDQWLHVQYENLCSNPKQTLEDIASFIGIDARSVCNSEEEFSQRHTIAGNKHRFLKLHSVREDKTWKDNLSSEQISTINTLAKSVQDSLRLLSHP